jgi:hypothetical protein
MAALSEVLIEHRGDTEKPDPDAFQSWRDNRCTQYHLDDLKIRHQELLEIMATLDTGNPDDDSKGFYKLQGGIEAIDLIIQEIEDAYYPIGEDDE